MRALDLFSAAAGRWTLGLYRADHDRSSDPACNLPRTLPKRPAMPSVAVSRANDAAMLSERRADILTHVELTHIEKRIENWIRFGRHVGERIIDRRRRIFSFRPGSVFAFVRWAANDYGTVASRIDIVRAVDWGEPYHTLPFVRPGGDILLHIDGWPKVERALQHIDAVDAAGIDPCDAAPDHWRHVANRIDTGHDPRPYTMERHRAWLKRREIER